VNQSTLTVGLIVLGVLLLAWVIWPRRTHRIQGTTAELEPRIARLMQSATQTFLIIQVARTKDFLQLTARSDSAQIDFPLITERQRALEPRIREAAEELRLDFHEKRGSDGSCFLDCDFRGTPSEIAQACRELLTRVFGISENATLLFESDATI
jgi:hypothetical protein